ncbi:MULTISPECIES: GntR family transcriptional regulator [unclassified Streptomyces]|uniref:GntR family transcriptional regulator n=1 Tax=unclassified Streptomyces TaxID=2593676 RepID=UPI002E81CCBC|nr:GntR family transcriptional regulator [Streptomyces sp. NBC_00589]WTI42267.1 GntR family transcriptional regulator [Streptomyces sp. NBC_00775]WUB24051.1 GntR family transcriptional regulator [Streptomyces sp. NBC_00589]
MGTSAPSSWIAGLEKDKDRLGRGSTAERVAGVLRQRVTEGDIPPGTRLSEEAVGAALGVSRNTLREAFRLLAHERLLVHELNRGVFVRTLDGDDVAELYRLRRLVESAAVREVAGAPDRVIEEIRASVEEGERAAAEQLWPDVATADLRFHHGIVRLSASPRLADFMLRIHAELRLAFHAMGDPRRFHAPYLTRNRELLAALEARDAQQAELLLSVYLADAERQLLRAFADRGPFSSSR